MAGGRSSRTKGVGGERELVTILRTHGILARRVPLSGAADGFKGDVQMVMPGTPTTEPLTIEVKRRAGGFNALYGWLGKHHALALRDDYHEWLVVMRLDDVLARIVPPNTPALPDEPTSEDTSDGR